MKHEAALLKLIKSLESDPMMSNVVAHLQRALLALKSVNLTPRS